MWGEAPFVGVEVFGNPGFYVTYAVVQAGILILLARLLDPFERQPVGMLAVAALWGATGAAFLALVGNEAIQSTLSGAAQVVFADAISAPIVEEVGKGIALVLLVLASVWASKRFGTPRFEGLTAGIVFGAAVGLGFAFTEDFFYFVDRAGEQGLGAGGDLFLTRRDFFGPAALHHPLFTAAFGAGLGLATWSRSLRGRILWPLAGLATAIGMHAINNGLLELILVRSYGLETTAAWVQNLPVAAEVENTADTAAFVLAVLDYVYIAGFLVAILFWQRYQRKVVAAELEPEVANGVVEREDYELIVAPWKRTRHYFRLLRDRSLEEWRRDRARHREIAALALGKWRVERFGGDLRQVELRRRRVVSMQSIESPAADLPAPSTEILGRETELEDVANLLVGGTRAVTVIGPGGIGKTRLATELARRLAGRYASGAHLIELATITEPVLVPGAIARAIGVREAPDEAMPDRLSRYLADKQMLLVLDNFEQVTQAGPAVGALLAAAPRLAIVVTSRIPLRIAGEHEYPLTPLSVLDPAHSEPNALRASPAVQLFADRAGAVAPSFELDDTALADVAELCFRLDGLPLAIELAAARARILAPGAMLAHLGSRLELASGGSADRPERHRTLSAAIGWSEALLDDSERELFRSLSVFRGGARLDAIAAVAASDLGRLETLVAGSLVRQRPDPDGEPRFSMMETIRDYAGERLVESGRCDELRRRHSEFFLELARRFAEPVSRADRACLSLLELEQGNLRAAMDWSLEAGEPALGIRLASAVAPFWERGYIGETRAWMERALADQGALPAEVRALGLALAGRLALLQADYPSAEALLGRAISSAAEADDQRSLADAVWQLGWVSLFRGDKEKSRRYFTDALELSRELQDLRWVARSLASLARVLAENGETERASALLDESVEILRGLGDERALASALSGQARVALQAAQFERADAVARESLQLARVLEDLLRIVEVLYPAAIAALALGDDERAALLARERLAGTRELGDSLGVAECLELVALVDQSDPLKAARLLGVAGALRERLGVGPVTWPMLIERQAQIRERLGPEQFELAKTAGAGLSVEEAMSGV